jgi:hypothetical protein
MDLVCIAAPRFRGENDYLFLYSERYSNFSIILDFKKMSKYSKTML